MIAPTAPTVGDLVPLRSAIFGTRASMGDLSKSRAQLSELAKPLAQTIEERRNVPRLVAGRDDRKFDYKQTVVPRQARDRLGTNCAASLKGLKSEDGILD
jgi:hypothetical protein